MNKFFTFLLALTVGAGTLFAENVNSGNCGKEGGNLTWEYTNRVLSISGNGSMADYLMSLDPAPWDSYSEWIKTVVIANGATDVGQHAFSARS